MTRDALTAAKNWLGTFNPGDEIDEESGFTANHLAEIIRMAESAQGQSSDGSAPGAPIQPAEVWPAD